VERTLLHSPFRCELQRLVSVDFTFFFVFGTSAPKQSKHGTQAGHQTPGELYVRGSIDAL
jgi:hypothetical protein